MSRLSLSMVGGSGFSFDGRGRRRVGSRLGMVATVAAILFSASTSRCDDPPRVTARLADGRTPVGKLLAISSVDVALGDPLGVKFPLSEIVRLDFPNGQVEAFGRTALIELANGDRIAAGLTSMSDEAVVALWKAHSDWPPVRIPAETIAGIVMSVPHGAVRRSAIFSEVFEHRQKSDVVLLVNGDRAAGDLVEFDQAHLKLAQGGKNVPIEMSRVRAVSFNASLSNLPRQKSPRIQVLLSDGSFISGNGASCEAGGPLRLTAAFGAALEIPLSAVSAIRFLDGRATYLSEVQPVDARLEGFFGSRAPVAFRKDHNLAGGPLAMRGLEFSCGIGTRSGSRITFDLGARYRQFQTSAGLDDLAQGKGSVRFVVERDGKRAFESPSVTGSQQPISIGPLDVTGVQRLTLVVEYGELADIDDWANWCDAIVSR